MLKISNEVLLLFSMPSLIIVIDDIVINQKIKAALAMSSINYIISCVIFYFKFSNDNYSRVLSMLLILPVYIIVFIIFYLIKYLIMQNEMIENSLKDITIKNIEKDNLYKNLREAYSKVESITALRERNKIAAEIHDTVGHTLTTVLVELEASKRLMSRDIDRSKEKLSLAQEQVRKGLNDIRSSVRILERGEDILDFFNSLEALIEDTEKHSEVIVKRSIDKDICIPDKDIQEIIFSALMEGLSNGIRHGKSTAFFFKLSSDKDKIYFFLQDNGTGATVISPGFGLRAMRARVEEVNGTLETTSISDEGFCLYITFNVKK
jgi:signal transduction histidine kinase